MQENFVDMKSMEYMYERCMVMVNDRNIYADLVIEYSPWLRLDHFDWGAITSGIKPRLYKKNTNIYHQQQYSDYIYRRIRTGAFVYL